MPTHLARVKSQLTLQSRRKVLSQLEGEFVSLHTGPGTDFHDLREYVRGDDVKDLDWKASARTGDLLVKRFSAVRKHTVLLVVSTGRSMAAPHTLDVPSATWRSRWPGSSGWLASRQADLVGMVYGDAGDQRVLPPRAGELHLERGLDAVHGATRPDSAAADAAALLRHVARTQRRRAILLLVCDDEEASPELDRGAAPGWWCSTTCSWSPWETWTPSAVPAARPAPPTSTRGWRLPAWVRDDARLTAELARDRAARRAGSTTSWPQLGVVHEHLDARRHPARRRTPPPARGTAMRAAGELQPPVGYDDRWLVLAAAAVLTVAAYYLLALVAHPAPARAEPYRPSARAPALPGRAGPDRGRRRRAGPRRHARRTSRSAGRSASSWRPRAACPPRR